MKRLRRILNTVSLLCCLTVLALAQPAARLAIVTPLSPGVKLDGVVLKAPKIVTDGQRLSLPAGASARLQVLGSSKETVIKGQTDYTISKATLEKDARVLSRGSIELQPDLADLTRAAAISSRPGTVGGVDIDGNYLPVGLALGLPPSRTSEGWRIPVLTPDSKIQAGPGNIIKVSVEDLDDAKQSFELDVDQPARSLDFPEGMLTLGHRYRVTVERPGKTAYVRYFQLLTPQEQAEIDEAASLLRVDALKTGDVSLLLRLANFYRNVDDAEKAVDVLKEVVSNPGFQELNPTTQQGIKDLLNRTLNSLDRQNYVASE